MLRTALATLDRIAMEERGELAMQARAAVAAARKPRSRTFMRIYIDRLNEISADIAQSGARKAMTMHVLTSMAATLGEKSQRLEKTQAELAAGMGLSAPEMSRAVTVLAKAGALILRRQAGKSVTWEIDATYASAMPEPMRLEAIDRQEREVEQERRAGRTKAAGNIVRLREVPLDVASVDLDTPATDPRPLPLIP